MIAPIVTFAFDTLVWTGALIVVVLVLRRPVARWFGPGLGYALWLLPLARLALPPLVLPWAPVSERFAPVASDPVPAAPGADTMVTTVTIPAQTGFVLPWELLLTAAWLGGAAVFLLARWLDYRKMRERLLRGAVEVDRREGVGLVETPAVAAPVAFGLRDKVIALPPRFLISGSLEARALAIEHELAHHRGRDLLANWLAQPLLALHWFNPLAWAAWNAMRRDQEAACDARALAAADPARRAAYARVIAGFAAGERLNARHALAAPMACPISLGAGLGDKSIVHRLRSLTRTDISVGRRRAGRWALGLSAALALPLTATVVYAGQDVPEAEPITPAAPKAPTPREAKKVERRVIVMEHRDHADAKGDHPKAAKFERKIEKDGKTIVIRSDEPIDEAELDVKLEKLDKLRVRLADRVELLGDGKPGKAMRRFAIRDVDGKGPREGRAMAFALSRCADGEAIADADASHESKEADGRRIERTRIVMCSTPGQIPAEALASVRSARDRIAANDEMSAEVRDDILRQLDETIARLEREGK